MPADLISTEMAIRSAPVGTMLYSRVSADGAAWETDMLIREDPPYVAKLPPDPRIQFRSAAIEQAGIWLIPLMIRFNPDMLYETWVNVHAAGAAASVRDLARQTELRLLFFTPARSRSLSVRNPWQSFFAEQVQPRLETWPTWPMAAFDRARDQVYARYPTPASLWRSLG